MSQQAIQIHDLQFIPLFTAATIQQRIAQLGQQIASDYANKCPVFVVMLNGGFIFASDIVRHFEGDCTVEFVKYTSYQGTVSTNMLSELLPLRTSITGKHVVILEDIIDTGLTMHFFINLLCQQQPASIALATCLYKPKSLQHSVKLDYVGFSIEDKFVVGYGLDYNGYGRNLAAIYQLA